MWEGRSWVCTKHLALSFLNNFTHVEAFVGLLCWSESGEKEQMDSSAPAGNSGVSTSLTIAVVAMQDVNVSTVFFPPEFLVLCRQIGGESSCFALVAKKLCNIVSADTYR